MAEYVARKAIPREEVNFLQADCSDSEFEEAERYEKTEGGAEIAGSDAKLLGADTGAGGAGASSALET